ncbi:hypothetical protein [Psychroserpens sp.]|uniref:hypothetical protein n=1 Tax=Psychroserpens sp. TaxID=2020870 RepID=UPI002B267F3C|nr:hypothetical protein [Psychroserpens sp.]
MKNIIYLVLALFIFSCNSDNSQEPEEVTTNTLIIKQINDVRENYERNYFFDPNGRLDSITDTEVFPSFNYILAKFEYSSDNKLIGTYSTGGSEDQISTLTYNNNIIANYSYVTIGLGTNSPVSINENSLRYYDDGETSWDLDDQEIELKFNSNSLQYITQRRQIAFNYMPNSDFKVTNYEYDTNFNLIGIHQTQNNGNPSDLMETSDYDDKKNPIAESMNNYRLALTIIRTNSFEMSPNNVLSRTNFQGTTHVYEYIYNDDDYPISIIKTNSNTNEVTNTLTYTYY